jgi:hypothetical protein
MRTPLRWALRCSRCLWGRGRAPLRRGVLGRGGLGAGGLCSRIVISLGPGCRCSRGLSRSSLTFLPILKSTVTIGSGLLRIPLPISHRLSCKIQLKSRTRRHRGSGLTSCAVFPHILLANPHLRIAVSVLISSENLHLAHLFSIQL